MDQALRWRCAGNPDVAASVSRVAPGAARRALVNRLGERAIVRKRLVL
jgi:hypothetical protein